MKKRKRQPFVPLVSTLAASFVFLFSVISLLSTPPPIHHHNLLLHSSYYSMNQSQTGLVIETSSSRNIAFVVPENGEDVDDHLWNSAASGIYHGCSNATPYLLNATSKTEPHRFLLIATSGGLNQQRTGIIDAVVAAYILNATLVVPKLDHHSFWKDNSDFGDVFDIDWFISSLSQDVMIVKNLPTMQGSQLTPYEAHVPRKCTPNCYRARVLPLLNKKHAVQLGKFDYRLSNSLNTELQKLRCRVNYHGLKFARPIREMGQLLVDRIRMKSRRFVAVHLRYEADMLAFSGCYYGGGEKEREDLGAIRKRWKTLHATDPERLRRHGRCPLTAEEVALMLRAIGFGSDVHVYVASGQLYGGQDSFAPLKALFPNLHSKETLATKEELKPFASHSSRMAALDFIVCDQSDVFVPNNKGNMARMLTGARRYFGHKPTIRPNAKKLYQLFLSKHRTSWREFSTHIRNSHTGSNNSQTGDFYENPLPCICQQPKKSQ